MEAGAEAPWKTRRLDAESGGTEGLGSGCVNLQIVWLEE